MLLMLQFNAAVEPSEIVNQLFPNLWIFIAHLLATIVLLIILSKWVYNPFRKAMRKRADFIESKIMSAVDKEVSANKHQKKATLLLAQAQLKAQDLVSDAEQEAENKKLYILQAARQEIINLSAQNEQVLKQQKLSMKNDIEKAIVENAFLIANKILEHEIDDKQHQDIIDKFIRNLK